MMLTEAATMTAIVLCTVLASTISRPAATAAGLHSIKLALNAQHGAVKCDECCEILV